jgi:hypothetical protein
MYNQYVETQLWPKDSNLYIFNIFLRLLRKITILASFCGGAIPAIHLMIDNFTFIETAEIRRPTKTIVSKEKISTVENVYKDMLRNDDSTRWWRHFQWIPDMRIPVPYG